MLLESDVLPDLLTSNTASEEVTEADLTSLLEQSCILLLVTSMTASDLPQAKAHMRT